MRLILFRRLNMKMATCTYTDAQRFFAFERSRRMHRFRVEMKIFSFLARWLRTNVHFC